MVTFPEQFLGERPLLCHPIEWVRRYVPDVADCLRRSGRPETESGKELAPKMKRKKVHLSHVLSSKSEFLFSCSSAVELSFHSQTLLVSCPNWKTAAFFLTVAKIFDTFQASKFLQLFSSQKTEWQPLTSVVTSFLRKIGRVEKVIRVELGDLPLRVANILGRILLKSTSSVLCGVPFSA